jgi:hypothetical protein
MAYTLVVKVSGLCLFVPNAEGTTLWGLMIRTHAHEGHHVDEHFPVVAYDAADARPREGEPGECRFRHLDGSTYAMGGALGPDMRDEVGAIPGSFSRIHGKRAPASWFNAGGEALFAARVTITGTTTVAPEGGVLWRYARETRRLPTRIACTIPMDDDDPIVLQTKDGPLTLEPTPGGTLIIEFHNVPEDQLPPCGERDFPKPEPCDPPAHFEAYRQFLRITDAERPCYVGDGDGLHIEGVNPYACLSLPGCSEDDPKCRP